MIYQIYVEKCLCPRIYPFRAIANLSGVTVRALQYYDRIKLLRPSRTINKGFRLYAEADLLNEAYGGHPRLKQRIAEACQSGRVPQDKVLFDSRVWEFIQKACEAGKVGL